MKTDYEELGTHVYVWIGTTDKNEEEYYKYFELNCEYELDDPNYQVCGFCKDIGEKWYDEDFAFFPPPLEEEVSITELLEDSIVFDKENVVKKCNELGIKKANAMFGYATPDDFTEKGCLHVTAPYKENYNGLRYIGKFFHG
jgi:hypothetical protein